MRKLNKPNKEQQKILNCISEVITKNKINEKKIKQAFREYLKENNLPQRKIVVVNGINKFKKHIFLKYFESKDKLEELEKDLEFLIKKRLDNNVFKIGDEVSSKYFSIVTTEDPRGFKVPFNYLNFLPCPLSTTEKSIFQKLNKISVSNLFPLSLLEYVKNNLDETRPFEYNVLDKISKIKNEIIFKLGIETDFIGAITLFYGRLLPHILIQAAQAKQISYLKNDYSMCQFYKKTKCLFKALKYGAWCFKINPDKLVILTMPKIRYKDGFVHSKLYPAVEWKREKYYFIYGKKVDKKTWKKSGV